MNKLSYKSRPNLEESRAELYSIDNVLTPSVYNKLSDFLMQILESYDYVANTFLERVVDAEKALVKGELEVVYYWAKWENIDQKE